MKAWLASVAAALAVFQLFTAAWIFPQAAMGEAAWVNPVHRWSGRIAFIVTLPVAYLHLQAGLPERRQPGARHSLLGSAFCFAAKITIVELKRFPTAVLPISGGLLFAVLIGVWYRARSGSSASPGSSSSRRRR